jgi:seryl-tRNA synthetase
MKEKILTALKTKYKDLGFGEKAFEGVADYLAKTVTEEDKIETAIGGVETLLKSFQSEGDRRASELQKTTKELQDEIKALKEKKAEPKESGKPAKPDYDSEIQALKQKLEGLEKLDKQREARAALKERAKEKKIPNVLIENIQVDSIDKVDEIVSEMEKKASILRQELINQDLGGEPPKKSSGPGGNKEQIAEDIKSHPVKVKK